MKLPKSALIILAEGFEEMEAIAPIDLLRRAGVEVTTTTISSPLLVKGRNNITVQADIAFKEVSGKTFDMIIIPGGPGHVALREDESVLEILRRHSKENRWIAAICAAPVVLKTANVLGDHQFTCHVSVEQELPLRIKDRAVVVDKKLITSQGAGTSTRFGLALVEALCGNEKAEEIARSIAFKLAV